MVVSEISGNVLEVKLFFQLMVLPITVFCLPMSTFWFSTMQILQFSSCNTAHRAKNHVCSTADCQSLIWALKWRLPQLLKSCTCYSRPVRWQRALLLFEVAGGAVEAVEVMLHELMQMRLQGKNVPYISVNVLQKNLLRLLFGDGREAGQNPCCNRAMTGL